MHPAVNWALNHGMMYGSYPLFPIIGLVLLLWSVFWKGAALWHAARRNEPWWFVILLVVNTLGVLEIIYLFMVAEIKVNQLLTPGEKK